MRKIIIPTAINIITMINETLIIGLKRASTTSLELPGVLSRAAIIVSETGVLPVSETLDEVGGSEYR